MKKLIVAIIPINKSVNSVIDFNNIKNNFVCSVFNSDKNSTVQSNNTVSGNPSGLSLLGA